MLSLDELKETMAPIGEKLEAGELELPEPSAHWRRRIEALEKAKLINQRMACLFDMRCEQAEALGFKRIDSSEMIKMLMGAAHTKIDEGEGEERQTYSYVYFHDTDEVKGKKEGWGGKPTIFVREEKAKHPWWKPPFLRMAVEAWRTQFGKLDYLKRDIPYPVVLQMNELKKLKLFNVFNVMAPQEAWERKTDIDPIVVATIWEMPLGDDDKPHKAGQTAHFFLAQW